MRNRLPAIGAMALTATAASAGAILLLDSSAEVALTGVTVNRKDSWTANHQSEFPWHNLGVRDWAALTSAGLISALSTSAGIGGGPFFVPIINIIAGLGLKSTIAVSQAAVAGGSLAGVLCGLLSAGLSGSDHQLLDFPLALQYGPLLFLGTSAGVVLTRSVPDYLIVGVLFLMMALLALKVLAKGRQLWQQETHHLKAAQPGPQTQTAEPEHESNAPPQEPETSTADPPPTEGEADLKPEIPQDPAPGLASFPIDLEADLLSTRSSWDSGATPGASDDETGDPQHNSRTQNGLEERAQSRLGKYRASPPPASTPEEPSTPIGDAEEPDGEQAPDLPEDPEGVHHEAASPQKPARLHHKPRRSWLTVLQGLLLLGVVVGFMALQQQKARFTICTRGYNLFYVFQVGLCLLVSLLSLALLRRPGVAESDAEAPLLPQAAQPAPPHAPISRGVTGLATVLGGAAAGLTGLGGGQILSPLFLELGSPPQETAATSLLLVLCNSASAALQFALARHLDTGYALVYGGLCFGSSVLGYLLMARLITATGHPSFLVFLLGIMLSLGGVAVVALGLLRVVAHIREDGRLPGFDSICH